MTRNPDEFKINIDSGAGFAFSVRLGTPQDAADIQELYFKIYSDDYPLTVITDLKELKASLGGENYFWFLIWKDTRLVGNVIFEIDREQRMGKVFGAVVDPEFRGYSAMKETVEYVMNILVDKNNLVDSIYATTRTVSLSPQKILSELGYVKLGIFPNTRKVHSYETHCLAVYFSGNFRASRLTPVRLTPELKAFYSLVQGYAQLEDAVYDSQNIDPGSIARHRDAAIPLEVIQAKGYIEDLFYNRKDLKEFREIYFYPFHAPNVLLWSKEPEIEIFCHYSEPDQYAVIIGAYLKDGLDKVSIFASAAEALRNMNARYIEMMVDAYNPAEQRAALATKFIPSGYYPGMWLNKKTGRRHDFWVFSKTFEMLDFSEIKLEGENKKYLEAYFNIWKMIHVDKVFLK